MVEGYSSEVTLSHRLSQDVVPDGSERWVGEVASGGFALTPVWTPARSRDGFISCG